MINNRVGPIPTCAICKKPVEKITKYRDELYCRDRYIVECHGDKEVTDINDEVMHNAISIEVGYAFTTKKLESDNDM